MWEENSKGVVQGKLRQSCRDYKHNPSIVPRRNSNRDATDLYHGAAILNFSHYYQCYQTEAGRTKIVWFLFAKWLLTVIVVIRYKEQDHDGGSMIKVY